MAMSASSCISNRFSGGNEYCQAILLLVGLHFQFEKTHVKLLQGLVLANSYVYTEFEDREESTKGAFIH